MQLAGSNWDTKKGKDGIQRKAKMEEQAGLKARRRSGHPAHQQFDQKHARGSGMFAGRVRREVPDLNQPFGSQSTLRTSINPSDLNQTEHTYVWTFNMPMLLTAPPPLARHTTCMSTPTRPTDTLRTHFTFISSAVKPQSLQRAPSTRPGPGPTALPGYRPYTWKGWRTINHSHHGDC
eukprot:360284-Chlamydomonas_euryale.AAC.3